MPNGWIDPTDLTAPYRLYWSMQVPDGFSTFSIYMNYEGLTAPGVDRAGMLLVWWKWLLAPLTSKSTVLLEYGANALKDGIPSVSAASGIETGQNEGSTAPLRWSMAFGLVTGDSDRWGLRRLYLPGTLARWQDQTVLNASGQTAAQTWARALWAVAGATDGLGPNQLLVWHPGDPLSPYPDKRFTAARLVRELRCYTYTGKAPTDL